MRKTILLVLTSIILLGGFWFYFNKKYLSNTISEIESQEVTPPYHKELLKENDYRYYYNKRLDSNYAKRLYKAEKHISNMMNLKELYGSNEDIGFADSSYTKEGNLYIRFIFGLGSDKNHKYAYDIGFDNTRSYVYEVDPNIEFRKKVSIESNFPDMNPNNISTPGNKNIDYNTEKWRKEAYQVGQQYLKNSIPASEPECRITSQGHYQPRLVTYHGNGVFDIIAVTSFDCNKGYINRKAFFLTMVHYNGKGWDATLTDQKFLD